MGNKIVGIILAVSSGFLIGVSFIFKKKGLLAATEKSGELAGQGHAYLKNYLWWFGMTLMILGEICNFVAYAFTEAILVTPLGAITVVVAAIGSSIFLKERLSFVGKVGCFLCILGAVIIVLNAPDQTSVNSIQEMQKYAISYVFLPYVGVCVLVALFLVFWAGPRYGSKYMFVYIGVCSIIGGISVVCTQGFGASFVAAIGGTKDQWNQWFLYVLLVFVTITLLVEINYLNKALNIFNTSVVTPVYFTSFTIMTMVSSAVLFRGFNGTGTSIATIVMGFFCIVAGVVLLQVSLVSQNTPDSAVLSSGLDNIAAVLNSNADNDTLDPGPASIRGALSLRALSQRKVSSADTIRHLKRRQTINSMASSRSGHTGRPFSRFGDMHGNPTQIPEDATEDDSYYDLERLRGSQFPAYAQQNIAGSDSALNKHIHFVQTSASSEGDARPSYELYDEPYRSRLNSIKSEASTHSRPVSRQQSRKQAQSLGPLPLVLEPSISGFNLPHMQDLSWPKADLTNTTQTRPRSPQKQFSFVRPKSSKLSPTTEEESIGLVHAGDTADGGRKSMDIGIYRSASGSSEASSEGFTAI